MLYQTHQNPIVIYNQPSFDFVPHAHHNVELLICTDGEFCVSCKFKDVVLRRGDAMIAFSNDVHAYRKSSTGRGLLIIVSPTLLPTSMQSLPHKQYGNFALEHDEALVDLGNALWQEYEKDADMDVMVGYLYVIYGTLRKALPYQECALGVDAEHFSKILQYLSEHYTQDLSLKSISEHFGISACHLSRTFTQKLSCRFLQYLHSLRVEHAKTLLTQSSMTVLSIAYESGFSDQRTFNRVFKELTGYTPKEYRAHFLTT